MKSDLTSGIVRLQRIDEKKLSDARDLRRNMTSEEILLWKRLRNRKLAGLKFRRQQIIEGFIADFYCEEVKLAVEIDGSIHDTENQKEIDCHRDKVFAARGIFTLRIKNDEVVSNINATFIKIKHMCDCRLQQKMNKFLNPSPVGEGQG
jgi:very-short-patch-repair endonuclease